MTTLRTILFALAMCTWTGLAIAQDKDTAKPTEDSRHCISLSQVARTEIIDNTHIAFHMKGRNKIFVNILRRQCPGLRRHDTLMFRTFSSQVCNIDIVTVLDNIGFGFSPGVSCALGPFYLMTKEQLAKLKN